MLDQERIFEKLGNCGVTFFTGVPDSYLNGFCNYALKHFPEKNIIAANEGNAIGIAAGHYFATKELPLVYMQNRGMGNMINPLVSLVDEHVYSVPMLLLIGWRGQPGMGDWPQHELQGEITIPLWMPCTSTTLFLQMISVNMRGLQTKLLIIVSNIESRMH